jgi:hypothetical protein
MQYLQGTIQRHVTTGEAGNWIADFSVPGVERTSNSRDLISWHEDGRGTTTEERRRSPGPSIWRSVSHEIRANNWYYGDEVT